MGAGINLFKTLFPSEFYPYTANTLMSAKPTGKVIKDENDQTIETIVYSGNELRGLLKVVDGKLVADGDIDDGSGSTDIRYGIVDLGSLDWTYYEYGLISGGYSTSLSTQLKEGTGGDELYNAISVLDQYTDDTFASSPDLTFAINYYGYIKVHISGVTDSASLKSALSGKYLVYELATPTTATSTAWSNPIQAKQGGTETFVDNRTTALPTGHDTIYGTDLVVKKAEFGQTVYGGSVDFTTGEVISNKNADGTDKTPETIAISPVMVGVFEGNNNIVTDAQGTNTVKYFKKG